MDGVSSKSGGTVLGNEVKEAFPGREVVIITPTLSEWLEPLIKSLVTAGMPVHLRVRPDDTKNGNTRLRACRRLLGERVVVSTRMQELSCSGLIETGEFRQHVVIVDANPDGVLAAMKAAGISYPRFAHDIKVALDPCGKINGESSIGRTFAQAWKMIPPLWEREHETVLVQVVEAFSCATMDDEEGKKNLENFAQEQRKKIAMAKALATTAKKLSPHVRFVDTSKASGFDPDTLTEELRRDVAVVARVLKRGHVADLLGTQISIVCTKTSGKNVDLRTIVPTEWSRGAANGVIADVPSRLDLSKERWEEFQPLLVSELDKIFHPASENSVHTLVAKLAERRL